MSANPISAIATSATDKKIEPTNSSLNEAQAGEETSPLLPRSAWNSQLAYFQVILRAKLNLDKAEREALQAVGKSTPK